MLVTAQRHPRLVRQLEEQLGPRGALEARSAFPDLDPALEWAEDQLLARPARARRWSRCRSRAHPICRGLDPEQVETFEKLLEPMRFEAGDMIVRKGEIADRHLFLASGEVSVVTELPNGELSASRRSRAA